ncbi:MAG TPA: heme o synthase [Terriglobales bacterium]|nr:heme o synthase [Terriglobales bacterium]
MATTAAAPNSIALFQSKLRDYCVLTKPEVNLLILMATSVGYYLASSGPFQVGRFLCTLLGTLLVASGTATLNQLMEWRYDAAMRRTAKRPLACGRLSKSEALAFGFLLSVTGGLYLALFVNRLAAILAISTLLSYLLIYTPLKRLTPLCTLLGAIPGAMPTLIGWAGGSGRVDRQAWLLFALLFLWQFPHFLAIALMYREDYARAGFHMLPAFDLEGKFTKAEIVAFTILLVLATVFVGSPAPFYSFAMLAIGSFFLYYTLKLAASDSKALPSKVVHASVIYLPVVFAILAFWKR